MTTKQAFRLIRKLNGRYMRADFSGSGDSGQTDDVCIYDENHAYVATIEYRGENKDLYDYADNLVCENCNFNDDGMEGHIEWDVVEKTVVLYPKYYETRAVDGDPEHFYNHEEDDEEDEDEIDYEDDNSLIEINAASAAEKAKNRKKGE